MIRYDGMTNQPDPREISSKSQDQTNKGIKISLASGGPSDSRRPTRRWVQSMIGTQKGMQIRSFRCS